MKRDTVREIISLIKKEPNTSREDVNRIKIGIAKKYGLDSIPSNSRIIERLNAEERGQILNILRRKTVRSVSGVMVIAVMSKPWPCPQSNTCIYCPGGPKNGVPQSYTGREPAALRGIQNNYCPYSQVKQRIMQYKAIGYKVDKVELIVMGGTFPSSPIEYQEYFVKRCLDAINGSCSISLNEAKKLAEISSIRNVGITFETRPDWAKEKHVDHMLSMGATRVELGVQNVFDDVYRMVRRNHTVQDVVYATRVLKDSGLKIVYHFMPGLPGSTLERDLEGYKKIFSDQNFRPDMVKIYPCLVIEGTNLWQMWREGKYKSYTLEQTVNLISEFKRITPEWVRIMRVQRDIPAHLIRDGVKKSNLRELVLENLTKKSINCRCIRCREVGHRMLKEGIKPGSEDTALSVDQYIASDGKEYFISLKDHAFDTLIGYLRLRFPSSRSHRPEINSEYTSLVRELRVCGPLVPVGKHVEQAFQHKGFGKELMKKAEEISLDNGFKRIIVTSALGTKRYYLKLGYKYDGLYMGKTLS